MMVKCLLFNLQMCSNTNVTYFNFDTVACSKCNKIKIVFDTNCCGNNSSSTSDESCYDWQGYETGILVTQCFHTNYNFIKSKYFNSLGQRLWR